MKAKRCGKRSGRWLSDEAVQAKRQRRRLEARWRRTKLETDRVAYRRACRTANTHIVNSFYQQRLQSMTCEPNTPWRVIRELLHSEDRDTSPNPREAKKLCLEFSRFFTGKLASIARDVTGRLSTSRNLIMPPVHRPINLLLDHLAPVTVGEVNNITRKLPPKSSPLDILPVSFLKLIKSFGSTDCQICQLVIQFWWFSI